MSRNKKRDRHQERMVRGAQMILDDQRQEKEYSDKWNLEWFTPKGLQQDCVESFNKNTFTVIDGPSGSGKTTTALWWSLNQLKLKGGFDRIIFMKNPTETGDDQIGFLSGDERDKLAAHYETTKRIFKEFMSVSQLDYCINKDKIRLSIPNFELGATYMNSLVLLDESQLMSPDTIKFLTERIGVHSKYIILGDSNQKYAVKKRKDGFEDFINRVTVEHQGIRFSRCEPMVGYIKMSRLDNQRSEGSAFINKIYEEV